MIKLNDNITINGFWDNKIQPEFLSPSGKRKIVIIPRRVSLFGWNVWPLEFHYKGEMTSKEGDEDDEGNKTFEVCMLVKSGEERRAPIIKYIAWVLVGHLVWSAKCYVQKKKSKPK